MIVDENMVYVVGTSFEYADKDLGEKVQAVTLDFQPPTPRIDTTKLKQFIGRGMRSVAMEAARIGGDNKTEKPLRPGGTDTLPLHIRYKDGNEDERKKIIATLDEEVAANEAMLSMSDSIDLTEFMSVFGTIMCQQNQCTINGKEKLTRSIWENDIMPDDRLKAALRYCSFFGIISSMTK